MSLRTKLTGTAKPGFTTVVMPDFYLDYIVSYPGRFEDVLTSFQETARKGGGNLLGWKHTIGRGGKASNLASQLASLGAKTVPIFLTDSLGRVLLSNLSPGLDLSHVKTDGSLSRTVSLEASYSGRRVNLMISDPGSLQNFGPERLTDADRDLIRTADFVCMVSWNQNKQGTELAETVFKTAREGEHAVTFFDPGDASTRSKGELQGLNDRVLSQGLVDVLSVNEHELLQLASVMREDGGEESDPEDESSLFEAASIFSMLGSRVDLHTPGFSATFIDGQRERVPCLQIDPVKVTGAGDVWNAADVYAQGIGLDHKERLVFANATAAGYLSRESLDPVRQEEILVMVERLEKQQPLPEAKKPGKTSTKKKAPQPVVEDEADDFKLDFDMSQL